MKRILVVSPRFPPSNAADMHRVRQSLPYFRRLGWEPTVLSVEARLCEMPLDPWLETTVPAGTRVVHTGAADVRTTRRFGIGSFDVRVLPYLARSGSRLLATEPFDLVFFSTTAFLVMRLGPYWRRRFGVPYVLDMQDPWLSDYYDRPGAPPPPGGRLKHGVAHWLARACEPATMRAAAHVVSVSPAYPAMLRRRYPEMDAERFTVLPFGAPEADVERLRQLPVPQDIFDPADGFQHWVYVGRAGGDMELSLTALFTALARARQAEPDVYDRVRLHFVGTDYAPAGRERETVAPLAAACGVGDLVRERPLRVPYAEALQAMLDADALLMPGSDDPGYTASKLYPTILARKPLLAVFHEQSSVLDVLRETGAGVGGGFGDGETAAALASRIGAAWFGPQAWKQVPETDWTAFEPYTAREMARRLAHVFDGAAR